MSDIKHIYKSFPIPLANRGDGYEFKEVTEEFGRVMIGVDDPGVFMMDDWSDPRRFFRAD